MGFFGEEKTNQYKKLLASFSLLSNLDIREHYNKNVNVCYFNYKNFKKNTEELFHVVSPMMEL